MAHLLLSVGVLCALFALLSVFDQAWELVYAWLGLAMLLQSIQAADVDRLFNPDPGEPFDSPEPAETGSPDSHATSLAGTVSFLNCVFVPVVAMLHAGFMEGVAGVVLAGVVLLAALYRLSFLANHNAPIADQSNHSPHLITAATSARAVHLVEPHRQRFVGLPATWGILGFYLYAFDATPAAAVLTIGLGIILGLIPLAWPHPLYSERWPWLTRAVALCFLCTAATTLWLGLPATPWAKALLLGAALYGLILTAAIRQVPQPVMTDQPRS